jgi:hypothetical protein
MGKCEECSQKHASCGLPGDDKRERRWCCSCGKAKGAVNYGAKMCEQVCLCLSASLLPVSSSRAPSL